MTIMMMMMKHCTFSCRRIVFAALIVLLFIRGIIYERYLYTFANYDYGYKLFEKFDSKLEFTLPKYNINLSDLQFFRNNSVILGIVWINKPMYVNIDKLNLYLNRTCNYRNCKMITGEINVSNMAALIFSGQDKLDPSISFSSYKRPSDQVWVFFRMEPPVRRSTKWYYYSEWQSTMNWTWGYRLDSDIYSPYQSLNRRNVADNHRDYQKVFRLKTKTAALVLHNCHPQSQRAIYVHGLQKAGLSVDIFGSCKKSQQHKSLDYLKDTLNKDYKFLLAFENSFCKDYVAEFFYNFELDIIPIVRGSFNYSKHFEELSYISISDFSTIQVAADYINAVGRNESLYIQYLQKKDKFTQTSPEDEMLKSSCTLCKKLNRLNKHRKIYKNIANYIHDNTCFHPNDIR